MYVRLAAVYLYHTHVHKQVRFSLCVDYLLTFTVFIIYLGFLFIFIFFFRFSPSSKHQLNQQSLSESEVKEDDNETEHASAANNLDAGPVASKKKKKKRKKKSKYTGNHISSEDNEVSYKIIKNYGYYRKLRSSKMDVDWFEIDLIPL